MHSCSCASAPLCASNAGHMVMICRVVDNACCIAGGHPDTHKTKIICTIGPASESMEVLREMAANGMDIARLNMTHGHYDWHATIVERIREINRSGCAHSLRLQAGSALAQTPMLTARARALVINIRPNSKMTLAGVKLL